MPPTCAQITNQGGNARLWCEMLPWPRLLEQRTLELLQAYPCDLLLAVTPAEAPGLPDLARLFTEATVPLRIWPMLQNQHGRWLNVGNIHRFLPYVDSLLQPLLDAGMPAVEVVLDMEPDHRVVQTLSPPRFAGAEWSKHLARCMGKRLGATSALSSWMAGWQTRLPGLRFSTALIPPVLWDEGHRGLWQLLSGTLLPAEGAKHHSVMAYCSLWEGWGAPLLNRERSLKSLEWVSQKCLSRFGEKAGVSVGAVGVGALGNEPIYSDIGLFREELAVVRGVSPSLGVSVFDLAGILARPRPEAWLRALCDP